MANIKSKTGKRSSRRLHGVVSRRQRENEKLDRLIALALRSPPTEAEIHKFFEECRMGKHRISAEAKAALKRAEPELHRRIHAIIFGKPANDKS